MGGLSLDSLKLRGDGIVRFYTHNCIISIKYPDDGTKYNGQTRAVYTPYHACCMLAISINNCTFLWE